MGAKKNISKKLCQLGKKNIQISIYYVIIIDIIPEKKIPEKKPKRKKKKY